MLSESPWRTERCPQGLAIREVSEDLPDASTLPWPPHREASTAGVSTGLHCARAAGPALQLQRPWPCMATSK